MGRKITAIFTPGARVLPHPLAFVLGFPADDTEGCLLNDNGQPVPDGIMGEIAVKPLKEYVIFNGYFDDSGPWRRLFTASGT